MSPATKAAHVRWMICRDMPTVVEIERQSFGQFAWQIEDFNRALRCRRLNTVGMVAEKDDQIVGYMLYELHPRRIHLVNFAVAEELRRNGIGSHMIDKLTNKISSDRRSQITIEVAEFNLAAQLFFKSHGFKATKTLKGFFDERCDEPVDAYLMVHRVANGGLI